MMLPMLHALAPLTALRPRRVFPRASSSPQQTRSCSATSVSSLPSLRASSTAALPLAATWALSLRLRRRAATPSRLKYRQDGARRNTSGRTVTPPSNPGSSPNPASSKFRNPNSGELLYSSRNSHLDTSRWLGCGPSSAPALYRPQLLANRRRFVLVLLRSF